jgi:hypothetical protein
MRRGKGWVLKGSGDLLRCCLAIAAWREPVGSDRLPSIGVSLQPAIPRRVAPQQSPPPLHRSPTIVADPGRRIKCAAYLRCHLGCHFYFARRVTFLSCADKSKIVVGRETTRCRKSQFGCYGKLCCFGSSQRLANGKTTIERRAATKGCRIEIAAGARCFGSSRRFQRRPNHHATAAMTSATKAVARYCSKRGLRDLTIFGKVTCRLRC